MTVPEGGLLGERGELAVGAAAEGDADAGDHAGGVAGQGGHDPGGDADDAEVGGLQGVPDVADQDPDLAHDRCGQARGAGTGLAAVSATGAHKAVNSAIAAWQCTQSRW